MKPIDASTAPDSPRDIIIGAGSRVWRAVAPGLGAQGARFIALPHTQVAAHHFGPRDRIWIMAYSRRPEDNLKLFTQLRHVAPTADFVYITSSACIATTVTRCYGYPRVKQQATEAARRLLDARVLTLGLVYGELDELPRGTHVATSLQQLCAFLLSPSWPGETNREARLFSVVTRPFANAAEAALQRTYVRLQQACGRWPCLLRPLDVLLRGVGIRWYGYTALSNRLWTAKS